MNAYDMVWCMKNLYFIRLILYENTLKEKY